MYFEQVKFQASLPSDILSLAHNTYMVHIWLFAKSANLIASLYPTW